MREPVTVGRREMWLSLLTRLTDAFPRWAVWKNVESALSGTGDVDSFAPPGDWVAIFETFRAWSEENELGPLIVCRHIPQGPHYIALQQESPYLVQLDVKNRGTFRGSTLIDYKTLLPLSEIDERGFRRVRPGAEGIIKLCMNGTLRDGGPNVEGLKQKNVRSLLAADPVGVQMASELLGRASGAVMDGAQAVIEGSWDRRAMQIVNAWSIIRGVTEPTVSLSRLYFLKIAGPRCPVIQLIRRENRVVPADREAWLASVADDHDIYPRLSS